ncbi:MAG: leucyl/phenylalanyl-tRNA--protein transferase [Xanthomonadales bacterium]|nr:leucyl/phenylalanyl-tRNA--protein transferase [Xanthomonadales bacterium]
MIAQLGPDPHAPFPSPDQALRHPDGLLAFGGDLSVPRLLQAYALGIFPWYSEGQPILWWSPDPRMVVAPGALHVSRSMRRFLRRSAWQVTLNQSFARVIDACAALPRAGQGGTWITADMRAAYRQLHDEGFAHSIEVWRDRQLIGGIYGVALGRMFFGESMFSLAPNASKVAITALCRALVLSGSVLLDGQVKSEHLGTLGFAPVPRAHFLALCAEHASGLRPWPAHSIEPARIQPAALASPLLPASAA